MLREIGNEALLECVQTCADTESRPPSPEEINLQPTPLKADEKDIDLENILLSML